jgi:AcrR family transcriptional regulator
MTPVGLLSPDDVAPGLLEGSPELAALLADDSRPGRVLRAALRQISTIGIDRVTVANLLAESGVSRGTVYAHFGDVYGVFATIWSLVGDEWLRHVVAGQRRDQRPAEYDLAFVHILCLARRTPVLREVVQPDVEQLWSELATGGPMLATRAAWLLAASIGAELTAPVLPEVRVLDGILGAVASLPDDAHDRVGAAAPPPAPAPLEFPAPGSKEEDPITGRLLRADLEVVASSGVAAASMLRICRSARLTPGAAAPRFANASALHAYTFESTIDEVLIDNGRQAAMLGGSLSVPDINAMFIASSLNEGRRTWRNFRQELHIAAHHDPRLAVVIMSAFAHTNPSLLRRLSVTGATPEMASFGLMANQTYALGLSAVRELGIPLHTYDNYIPVRWIYNSLVEELES